jgi:tRNA(Ile2) C34 agmatinyltransferase TiaS
MSEKEEVCQDCGKRVKTKERHPAGFICDDCLVASREERADRESCF